MWYLFIPKIFSPLYGQYSRRARIAQSSALLTVADELASLVRDVSEGEACPTESSFIADQDRATIAKSSTLPHDSAPSVTSPAADEGNAATVLAGGIDVPTSSGSIPTAGPPATVISTGSEVGLTASPIVTSYSRRKGKEVMVESDTPKKDAEVARIHAEEELQGMIDSLDRSNETIAKYLPMTKKQKREYYMAMIRNNFGWKVKDFKGMSFEEIKAKFAEVWKQVEDFIPMGSKEKAGRLKRKDLLKQLDKEDLNQLWALVKEYLSIRPATSEKEMELWVELKRLYEPDPKDQLWTLTQNFMHAPVEWKLYDLSGMHHLTAKDKEIFMLVEKDYPLRKGLALVMISYKLQVENYSQMAEDFIQKIYNIANTPRQQGD
nr:hypothetical protein [Tanacetum cinerariifolium]